MSNNMPLFKLAIPFIVGILLQVNHLFSLPLFIVLLSLSFAGILFYFFFQKYPVLQNSLVYFLTLSIFLCSFSALYTHYKDQRLLPTYFSQHVESNNLFEIQICETPTESANSVKAQANIINIKDSAGWHNTSGKAIFYFEKTDSALNLQYGDRLLVTSSLAETKPPQNPYEFNYKQYLAHKQIHYQTYVSQKRWVCLKKGKINGIQSLGYAIQKRIVNRIKNSGLSPDKAAISVAFLLGIAHEIDADTMHAFNSAGILHVISVSGLHVGVIASIIAYLLFFLGKTKQQKIWKAVIQILLLFFFALITGLSPSVLRAAFMFSFLIVGGLIQKSPGNTYNNLAASAIILLLINPLSLMQVGFQLSYLGVLGIITFQPIFAKWIHSDKKFVNKIGSLITVTLAAQLGTMPLTLYYFHQFPLYFLFANVLIIPFVSVLLISIILVVVFAHIPYLGTAAVFALSHEIDRLYFVINYIEALPYSLIDHIPFNMVQAILLSAVIVLFALAFLRRKSLHLTVSLSIVICILLFNFGWLWSSSHQQKTTVYALDKKAFAIEFTSGNTAYIIGNKHFEDNQKRFTFQMENNQTHNRINHKQHLLLSDTCSFYGNSFFKKGHFVLFNNTKWLFFDKEMAKSTVPFPQRINYLVLLNNPTIEVEKLKEQFNFDTLVLASANYEGKLQQWVTDCHKLKIPYYSVSNSGALVVSGK